MIKKQFAAYVDKSPDGEPHVFYIEGGEIADHVAWRIAHFFDSHPEPAAPDFLHFLTVNKIEVVVYDDNDGNPELAYKIIGARDIAMPAASVCKEAKLELIAQQIPDIHHHTTASPVRDLSVRIVPTSPIGEQKAFSYAPSVAALESRSTAIHAALGVGLAKHYLDADKDDIITAKMTAAKFNQFSKAYFPELYSKTFTAQPGGGFSKSSNSKSLEFFFKPQASSSLDDFLETTYKNGSFTVTGRPVFYHDYRARRLKDTKVMGYNNPSSRGNPHKLAVDGVVAAYGLNESKRLCAAPMSTVVMPSIIEQQIRAVPVDIDDYKLSRKYNIETELDQALSELRSALPLALRTASARVMLSSSAGLAKSEDGDRYAYNPVTDNIRCRIWFDFDHPISLVEIKEYLSMTAPLLKADEAIYRTVQPIYGAPNFVGAPDPLAGKRYLTIDGTPKVDTSLLYAEFEQHMKMVRKEAPTGSVNSQTDPVLYAQIRGIQQTGYLKGAVDKLAVLGDREAMRQASGKSTHFEYLTQIVNAQLREVYDNDPVAAVLSRYDVSNPAGSSFISQQVRFMNQIVAQAFIAAVNDPSRETSLDHLDEFGIEPNGRISPDGKYAQLVADANSYIRLDIDQQRSKLSQVVRSGRRCDAKDIHAYTEKCCASTDLPGVFVEFGSGNLVAYSAGQLYIEDPAIKPEHRLVSSYDERRPFVFDSLQRRISTKDLHAVFSLNDIFSETNGKLEVDATAVFITNADPDIELAKVEKAAEASKPKLPRVRRVPSKKAPCPTLQAVQANPEVKLSPSGRPRLSSIDANKAEHEKEQLRRPRFGISM